MAKTIYAVYIRYFGQGNHQIYGHIRCIHTVLANFSHEQAHKANEGGCSMTGMWYRQAQQGTHRCDWKVSFHDFHAMAHSVNGSMRVSLNSLLTRWYVSPTPLACVEFLQPGWVGERVGGVQGLGLGLGLCGVPAIREGGWVGCKDWDWD